MSSVAAPTTVAGKPIGSIGFGLMGLTMPWKQISYPEAVKVMKAALEQGANFWNGGQFYGPPDANSLHLLKYYFTQYPEDADKVVLSIKGAFDFVRSRPTGSPEAIRASVEECLRVLDGCKTIDVFEMARIDPTVPVVESVQALAELVEEGKIGAVGLSEVSGKTIRWASSVTKIAAVEIELSLFTTDALSNGVVEACRDFDIPIIAYSPLGSGWLTGAINRPEDIPEADFRKHFRPRFHANAFDQNLKLVRAVDKVAQQKGATLAQVAISWVKQQGTIPLFGASTVERVFENCQTVDLSGEDLEGIQGLLDTFPVAGQRYGGHHETLLNL